MDEANTFQPNPNYLQSLLTMGIDSEHAKEALFCTNNESVEAAIGYVFNHIQKDSDDIEEGANNEAHESDKEELEEGYKMTFIVNGSLKMGIGKIAAQVAHACLGLYQSMQNKNDAAVIPGLIEWEYNGSKKIVLRGENTEHLEMLHQQADASGVPSYLVHDAGHTQIPAGSVTVLSLFGKETIVDSITGQLRLL